MFPRPYPRSFAVCSSLALFSIVELRIQVGSWPTLIFLGQQSSLHLTHALLPKYSTLDCARVYCSMVALADEVQEGEGESDAFEALNHRRTQPSVSNSIKHFFEPMFILMDAPKRQSTKAKQHDAMPHCLACTADLRHKNRQCKVFVWCGSATFLCPRALGLRAPHSPF